MSNAPMFSFGYPAAEGAIISWGARAIFRQSSERPLDFLPDRQQFTPNDNRELVLQLSTVLNTDVLPKLQEMGKFFSCDSTEKFVRHFSWPHDPTFVVVAQGSPNASYGYFYISCSLVPAAMAQAEIRPDLIAAERKAKLEAQWAENEVRQAEYRRLNRQLGKEIRAKAKAHAEEWSRKATGRRPEAGELLVNGDTITVYANQANREAIVIAVAPAMNTALVEYLMPNGRTFKWEVWRDSHLKLRNISTVPARFKQ